MVRNIDLPEALILYGSPIIWNDARSSWRSGLHELVEQCRADDAAVIMLVEDDSTTQDSIQQILTFPSGDLQVVLTETQLPPNPTDLLRALEALTIQPKAFGDPRDLRDDNIWNQNGIRCRSDQAARAAGMRVVRLLLDSHDNDTLADVVVGEVVDFSIDDIATPGSFWLNPPHPRDDLGNRVDPYEIAFQRLDCVDDELPPNGGELNDDELQRILADIDPL